MADRYFCNEHFSWLCDFGQGKCQPGAHPSERMSRGVLLDDLVPANPLCLDDDERCPTCGTLLRGGGTDSKRQPCPICGEAA